LFYKNLRAEMARANMTVAVLAPQIGISEKTLRNKLNGETDFTWPEALTIRRLVNPSINIEEMFEKEESKVREC
jgi:DNA-binding XRE family transcriptional regulator